jgi:hypothetical protein
MGEPTPPVFRLELTQEFKVLRDQSRQTAVDVAQIATRLDSLEAARAEETRRRSSLSAIIVTSTLSLIGALLYFIFSLSR